MSDDLSHALSESVNEGVVRLRRTWPGMLATGFVGGIDVSVGVYGAFVVLASTGNEALGALVFSFGFIALVMAGSELFTENFLVPIAAVAVEKGTVRQLGRLWTGTLVGNLVGGLLMVAVMMAAFPELGEVAIDKGGAFVETGPGLRLFLSAGLAGVIITLMTWMHVGSSMGPRLVAAVGAGFLLHFGGLAHVVVASLEVFAAMAAGAPVTVVEWLPLFAVMGLGNVVGGVGLVTLVRLVQVGQERVDEARRSEVPAEREVSDPDEEDAADEAAGPVAEHG